MSTVAVAAPGWTDLYEKKSVRILSAFTGTTKALISRLGRVWKSPCQKKNVYKLLAKSLKKTQTLTLNCGDFEAVILSKTGKI
jgi:hypothetical protein